MSSEEQNPNVEADASTGAHDVVETAEEVDASEERIEEVDASEERIEDVNPAELVMQIEELQNQIDKLKDKELRTQAEMHNVRRRAEQDVVKAHKFGLEKFVGDMLTVVDNLERALASMDAEDESLKSAREGIELTLKSMQDGLKRHNVEAIDSAGEPFDPEYHEAMAMVPNSDVEPNTVMDVFQKGYTLHGRLVRPAMVVVAKAP